MFQRILLPVDGTAVSEKAVPYALDLARVGGSEVVVCRVITTPAGPHSATEELHAAQYVERVANRFRAAGLTVKTQVSRGEAPTEIRKAALRWNADVIVMATRGRRRLEKLMLGSVADAVVRDSRLPVLLVCAKQQARKRVAA